MRRVLAVALVTAIALGAIATGPAQARSDFREREIRYARWDGEPRWSTPEVTLAIRTAVRRWPVVGGLVRALAVARCESGSDLLAPAEPGGYSGTFQQSERYWDGRHEAYEPRHWRKPLPESAGNPRANVVVSIRMAHANGWGAWDASAWCWG
jgi:hypothetical protein